MSYGSVYPNLLVKSNVLTLIKPPLNPPTDNVGFLKRIGIAKYTCWPSPQDTLNVFHLLFVNVFSKFHYKVAVINSL